MAEVYEEAVRRNVEIVALPTEAACRLIADLEPDVRRQRAGLPIDRRSESTLCDGH
jgi:metal-sulfur cluster biosynthetic enzyme